MPPFFHSQDGVRERSRWLADGLGRDLLVAEAQLLGDVLDDVFGLELLQLGGWGASRELLGKSRTRRQTVIAPSAEGDAVDLVARLTALPVQANSVDAVLLPHTLEFESDPHTVVREAHRVLTGEGQLIILGFRPWSLWGLRAAGSHNGFPAGLVELLPERRVRDWLALLGYELVQTRHYLYSPPWQRAGTRNPRRMLRRGVLNPLPSAAYLIKARKRLFTLTPIRPRLKERRKVFGSLAEPTTRNPS